jgi:hypothetical protein
VIEQLSEAQTEEDRHQIGMANALKNALNSYIVENGKMRADIVQAALGQLVTETFRHFRDKRERLAMLEQFCTILRETVNDPIMMMDIIAAGTETVQ